MHTVILEASSDPCYRPPMSKTSKQKLLVLAVVLPATLVFVGGDSARAQEGIIKDASVHTDRPTKLDFTGSLGFLGDLDLGLAGWYSLPLVKDGFIPPINDSFNLELGATVDYQFFNGYGTCDFKSYGFAPVGGVRWDFYLTKAWTVFAKAKVGIGYRSFSDSCGFNYDYYGYNHTYFVPDTGVGAYWNFSPGMGMRFDLGYRGAAVGISINL
jgi:hypothetical protein